MAVQSALNKFGLLARAYRAEAGYTIYEQSLRLGMSAAQIAAIETGDIPPPEGYIARFAQWLKLNPEQLTALRKAASGSQRVQHFPGMGEQESKFVERTFRNLPDYSPALIRGLRRFLKEGAQYARR